MDLNLIAHQPLGSKCLAHDNTSVQMSFSFRGVVFVQVLHKGTVRFTSESQERVVFFPLPGSPLVTDLTPTER